MSAKRMDGLKYSGSWLDNKEPWRMGSATCSSDRPSLSSRSCRSYSISQRGMRRLTQRTTHSLFCSTVSLSKLQISNWIFSQTIEEFKWKRFRSYPTGLRNSCHDLEELTTEDLIQDPREGAGIGIVAWEGREETTTEEGTTPEEGTTLEEGTTTEIEILSAEVEKEITIVDKEIKDTATKTTDNLSTAKETAKIDSSL